MGRQAVGQAEVLVVVLVLHEDDRRRQELGDGLGHHGAHLGIGPQLVHIGAQEVGEIRQVEVPVLHGAHLGLRARQRGHRTDKVHGRILMAQVALVGVSVLGLAALHRAAALHLAAVEERAGLGVVELQGGVELQVAVLVQARDELVGDHLVHVAGMPDARAIVDVELHLEGLERGLLTLVVGQHVIGDGSLELARLHQLAIALVDGAAEAVGARNEAHVLGADAIAQEAREGVGGHKHAADMAEVQGLVAVGHARRHHGAARPGNAGVILQVRHGLPTPSKQSKRCSRLSRP